MLMTMIAASDRFMCPWKHVTSEMELFIQQTASKGHWYTQWLCVDSKSVHPTCQCSLRCRFSEHVVTVVVTIDFCCSYHVRCIYIDMNLDFKSNALLILHAFYRFSLNVYVVAFSLRRYVQMLLLFLNHYAIFTDTFLFGKINQYLKEQCI